VTRLGAGWVTLLALLAGGCAAAIPSVTDLELSGAVRFVVDGEALSAAPGGLPLLVARPGELCAADVLAGLPAGVKAAPVDALPVVEPVLDCVDFAPGAFFARWSPDGTRVAFTAPGPDADSEVWIYDVAAGAVIGLSDEAGDDTLPLWVNETTVVFLRTVDNGGDPITTWQRVDSSGGAPTAIARIEGSVEVGRGPRVVRADDPRIVFTLVRPDGVPAGIHSLDTETGELRRLYTPVGDDLRAGWRLIDTHPMGSAALVSAGRGDMTDDDVELQLVDLVDGGTRVVRPLFGSAIGDARFSSDGLRLLVWELGTPQGDALVVRSTGSDGDGEILVVGRLGHLGVFEDGATIDVGADLVLVRIE
jgi:hypothetical protein